MSDLYGFEFIGRMPFISHHDNILGGDELQLWRDTPEGKKMSKPGDDRTPPWAWQFNLYQEDGLIAIPADNLMSAL